MDLSIKILQSSESWLKTEVSPGDRSLISELEPMAGSLGPGKGEVASVGFSLGACLGQGDSSSARM